MGRCLSPCLRDLDPNLYRERLDAALALFTGEQDGAAALLDHIERQMRAASAERRYERAAWLRRRHARLRTLLSGLGGVLRAIHAGSRLVLAPHPSDPARHDAFWVVGGRVVDWGPLPDDPAELASRTAEALRAAPRPERGGWLRPEEITEARIVGLWLAAHDDARVRELRAGRRGPGGAGRLGQRERGARSVSGPSAGFSRGGSGPERGSRFCRDSMWLTSRPVIWATRWGKSDCCQRELWPGSVETITSS